MELKTAIEILEYHQEWRLGKREDMIHEPKKLTQALDIVLNEVKKLEASTEINNTKYSFDDILLSNIENALERNLLGRDEDSETIERIVELFKNSERTQLKWHFKQI